MHTCISSHRLKRSWRSCPRRVNASNKNTPSTHHPRNRNVTTLMVGLKKTVTYAKISPKSGEPQRYSWGTHTHTHTHKITSEIWYSSNNYFALSAYEKLHASKIKTTLWWAGKSQARCTWHCCMGQILLHGYWDDLLKLSATILTFISS